MSGSRLKDEKPTVRKKRRRKGGGGFYYILAALLTGVGIIIGINVLAIYK